MMSGDIDSIYYTWHRDLHSFDMYLTYKDGHKNKNNQWKIKFVGKDFLVRRIHMQRLLEKL